MTPGQRRYVDTIAANLDHRRYRSGGGRGKSYLTVAAAVQALQSKDVHRIILARPAVEAGNGSGSCPAT